MCQNCPLRPNRRRHRSIHRESAYRRARRNPQRAGANGRHQTQSDGAAKKRSPRDSAREHSWREMMEHWRSRSTGRRYRYRSVRTSFPQLTDFWGEGGILTIAAVARTAGVSREFVHSRPYFHRAVIAAVKTSRDARALLTPSDYHYGCLDAQSTDYGQTMIANGFAQVPDVDLHSLFLNDQEEARDAGAGLWTSCPDFGTGR
jgi:hypothetical protein